jgi:hypothetical protein
VVSIPNRPPSTRPGTRIEEYDPANSQLHLSAETAFSAAARIIRPLVPSYHVNDAASSRPHYTSDISYQQHLRASLANGNTSLSRIPMGERHYFPIHDYDRTTQPPRILGFYQVNSTSLRIIRGNSDSRVLNSNPQPDIKVFTGLAGQLAPYIFPEVLTPSSFGPHDIPPVLCLTWRERLFELYHLRNHVRSVIDITESRLTEDENQHAHGPLIRLYRAERDDPDQLRAIRTDRVAFLNRLHPCYNPMISDIEAAFLRTACYMFRHRGGDFPQYFSALDYLLRTPLYDDFYI